MTPISLKPDAEPGTIGKERGPDFAARLKARLRQLRARTESRASLLDVVREANETVDPVKVARWLVLQAQRWIPAPCWAVVTQDVGGELVVLGEDGLTPELAPALWSSADWVFGHGTEFSAANLATDVRARDGAKGTALAFPLVCRSRTVGALVALDPLPSAAAPALGSALLVALKELLEPAGIAFGNALVLERTEALSVTDDLTRLYNFRYLNQALRTETKRSSRSGRPLSVLFIDLDGFKQVNDQHGHLAGSRTLVEVGGVIRGCARETDVVARFGGDEFAVVLPDTGEDGALLVARRILIRLRSFLFLEKEGLSVKLTASIGMATLPDMANTAEELLRAADAAMYRMKAAGKDGISIARQEDSPADSSILRLKE